MFPLNRYLDAKFYGTLSSRILWMTLFFNILRAMSEVPCLADDRVLTLVRHTLRRRL